MTLIKNLSTYTISSLISRAMPFFLLPLMTAYLNPKDYGVVAVVLALTVLVSSPLFCGVHAYVNVEYFNLSSSRHKQLVATSCLFPIALLLPLTAMFGVYAYLGGERWSVPVLWFVSIPFLAFLTFLYRVLTVLYRAMEQPRRYALLEVLYALVQAGLAILLVVVARMGVDGRLLSVLLASCVMSSLCMWQLWRMGYLSAGVDLKLLPDAGRFGIKVIPHELGQQVIRMADRLFVAGLAGTAAAGLYAVAAQVASIALILVAVFNMAWQPYVFRMLASGNMNAKLHLVKISRLAVVGFLLIFLLLYLAVPYIYKFFIAEEYIDSLEYVAWLLLGYFWTALYLIVCDYIFYAKRTGYLSLITSLNLLIAVILNVVLIDRCGAIGAAYSFAIASFITFCLAFYVSNRVYEMPWFRRALDVSKN